MCTNAEREVEGNECAQTGRHVQYKCVTLKGGESIRVTLMKGSILTDTSFSLTITLDKEVSSSVSYESCKRTEADEQFLMVRVYYLEGCYFFTLNSC